MQGFIEFSEEKKIVIKTKMGGEIPGTIKVTGKDYHIVKSDVGGKQYKTDHQGNALTEGDQSDMDREQELERDRLDRADAKTAKQHKAGRDALERQDRMKKEETDKDLPFTPDKKPTKPSTPGKYGDAYSTVRNLARRALEKQKVKAVDEETEELDERSEQSRQNKTKKNVMDASRGARYRQTTGVEMQPSDTGHKTAQQMNKALGRQLRREDLEEDWEAETPSKKPETKDDEKLKIQSKKNAETLQKISNAFAKKKVDEAAPVAPAPTVHRIGVTLSDPSHTLSTKRGETIQRFVRVSHHNDNKDEAIARGKKHFEKKGWKVHDAWHAGNLHEGLEGYRGSSKADEPYWEAQDHKQAAEKARKSNDHFSYHKFMSAHHDSMAHWNSNKERHSAADQHMNKSDEHEQHAQEIRKGAK